MAKDKPFNKGGGEGRRGGVSSTVGAISDGEASAPEPAAYVQIEAGAISPADARVAGGPRVWAVIGQLRANDSNLARTAADYDIPVEAVEAVEAALAYYWQHQTIIDGRLAEQAAFFAPASR